jgi:hypothetical protein
MLEHVPAWLGRLLADRRAGVDKLVAAQPGMGGIAGTLTLTSPAFADGARLPERFTADDEGVSPPLTWTGAPAGARLALLVEDPDAPASQPLVHAIVWGLEGDSGRLEEGAISSDGGASFMLGRNSYMRVGWLPPDPPTGHGEHRYAFQLFALGPNAPDPGEAPGRSALIDAMDGNVLASDVLIGTYSRGEPAATGPAGAAVAA